jgi:hypothetical protein
LAQYECQPNPSPAQLKPDIRHGLIHVTEWEVEGLGRHYLRDQADIRNSRPLAVAEDPARRMFGEQPLNPLQPCAEPMLDPGEP